MADFPINTVLSYVNDLALEFGVNAWQLQSGKYNGEYFFLAPDALGRLNARFNPAAGIIDNTESLFSDSAPAQNDKLGWGNIVTVNTINDSGKAKLKIFKVPNAPDAFEDLGWEGEVFTVNAIIAGNAYQNAIYNFFYKVFNPPKNLSNGSRNPDLNVLVHPVLGTINDCRLIDYKRVHTSNLWRASIWQLTFRSSAPLYSNKDAKPSNRNQTLDSISNILSIIQSILNTYSLVTGLIQIVPNGNIFSSSNLSNNTHALKSNIINDTSFININLTLQEQVLFALNNTIAGMLYLIDNFAPEGFNSPLLNNVAPDYQYVYPQLNYFKHMSPSDVNNLVNTVYISIDIAMAIIGSGAGNSTYQVTEQFQSLMTYFSNLASSLMNNYLGTTKQYTVTSPTSMLLLCQQNNLDYNTYAPIIWKMNNNLIPSYNYIPKGAVLTIPLSGNNGKN